MSKAKRHVKKERARKNKELLERRELIREGRETGRALMNLYTMEPPKAPKGHPLENCPIPLLTKIGDKYTVMTPELHDQLAAKRAQYSASIKKAEKDYPKNADENMKIMLDDLTMISVNIRVFMSIREWLQSTLEAKVCKVCKRSDEKLKSLMLEHKDAMMKKETEWLTKMENEKIELGKQIAIRDQMVLEARAETNEYKSMNQSILSQISDKEAKIAQVASQIDQVQTTQMEETMKLMAKAKEETGKMEEHRKEVAELKEKVKNTDANHQKQLQTKKFLIDKLKEERVKLQSENATLKKQLNDERSKMQSKILTLEEENEKLTKENKNKKLASQQNKAMSELNKLREEVQRRKKENEVERKQFEEKMVEMEKIVEGLKSRIKKLESTLRQNEVEYRNDLQKNQQDLEAKEKEIQLFKSEIKSLQDIVDRQKNTETKKVTEVSSKITDYQAKLAKAEAEVTKMKQDHAAQDLTFRVIQERLVFTTNEAEKYKLLAQEKITQERRIKKVLSTETERYFPGPHTVRATMIQLLKAFKILFKFSS